jgi:hypothetical protein
MPVRKDTMTRSISLSVGLSIMLLASRQSVGGQAKPRRPESSTSAEIHGSIRDCSSGKLRPVGSGLIVFALTMEESTKIRETINKIEQFYATHSLGDNDLPSTPLDDQFLVEVKSLRPHSKMTTTNQDGRYGFADLRAGKKYFLLAVNPEEENGLFYLSQLTPDLTPGKQTVDVGTEKDCHFPSR